MQDKLNIATCPSCGVSQFFPFPLVCNDMNRGLMIAIDEMLDTNSEDLGLQNDSDIEGVHYQRIPDDDVQIISVDDFEAARAAMLRLDDQAVIDSIKQAHPNWPGSLTYAEAFLRHYGAALESG